MTGNFGQLSHIPVSLIDRDPNQPRKTFIEETIRELAGSIENGGLVEPLIVKCSIATRGRYILVAGERRYRAVLLLGWRTVPCIVKPGDQDTYLLSVVENLNREDLNPIDEALAYRTLRDHRQMTWKQVSEVTRRSVPTIMNKIRLLELPEEIQAMVRTGTLPQVSALHLAQYKSTTGDLIRMAYDLMAGREPGEVFDKDEDKTQFGDSVRRGRMPTDSGGLFKRILGFAWRARSFGMVVQAFLSLPRADQQFVLKGLNSRARKNFLENLKSLRDGASKLINEFEAELQHTPSASVIPTILSTVSSNDSSLLSAPNLSEDEEMEEEEDFGVTPEREPTEAELAFTASTEEHEIELSVEPDVASEPEFNEPDFVPKERWATPANKRLRSEKIRKTQEPNQISGRRRSGYSIRPEPKPVFYGDRPIAQTSQNNAEVQESKAPVPMVIDLSKLSETDLDEVANILSNVFSFRGSSSPTVQLQRQLLAKYTQISDAEIQQKTIRAFQILRYIWDNGHEITHARLRRVVESFKVASLDASFERFFSVVPRKQNDGKYISLDPFH